MPMFRRKVATIEAWQWFGQAEGDMLGVCQCSTNKCPHLHTAHENSFRDGKGQIVFLTAGDWIIPEAKAPGRFYPVKPDIFAETYEPAEPHVVMAELTPEQQKAFEEEWSKPVIGIDLARGNDKAAWAIGERLPNGRVRINEMGEGDPVPAIGEHLTDIDADRHPVQVAGLLHLRMRRDADEFLEIVCALHDQLEAEGEHTEAANAEIERLNRLLDGKTQST